MSSSKRRCSKSIRKQAAGVVRSAVYKPNRIKLFILKRGSRGDARSSTASLFPVQQLTWTCERDQKTHVSNFTEVMEDRREFVHKAATHVTRVAVGGNQNNNYKLNRGGATPANTRIKKTFFLE